LLGDTGGRRETRCDSRVQDLQDKEIMTESKMVSFVLGPLFAMDGATTYSGMAVAVSLFIEISFLSCQAEKDSLKAYKPDLAK
jgi:hypothetical protein